MHPSIGYVLLLLTLAVSTVAYQVTQPSLASGWTTSGPNVIKWNKNSTDRLNFTAVLTNTIPSVMPNGDQVLAALVDGALDSITANPPSAGWPSGSGFIVNFVLNADSLSSILAHSAAFNITAPNATTTLSSQVATPGLTNAAATPTDTTRDLQPAGSTGGTGSMEINTIIQLGMIVVSGLFLMHLL